MKRSLGMGSRESGNSRFALRRSRRLLGLSIPESGSLRRSSRLLGKPAMNVPQLSQIKPRKPCQPRKHSKPPKHSKPLKRRGVYRERTLAEIMRYSLRSTVRSFLSCHKGIGAYPYGDGRHIKSFCYVRLNFSFNVYYFHLMIYSVCIRDMKVVKTCIYSGDIVDICPERNTPTGFTWVAVHGKYSTCAVFKKDLDGARRAYRNPECFGSFQHDIGLIAISEVEDLADKIQITTEPFVVVCVISGTANVHEVSSEKAVDFVRNKTGSGLPSTYSESIEIAIAALQLVWKQKFKAGDIWVSVWHPLRRAFLLTKETEEHLANINRPGSGFYTEEHLAWIDRPGEHLAWIDRPGEHLAWIDSPDDEALTDEHSPGNGGCVEEHLADHINGPESTT